METLEVFFRSDASRMGPYKGPQKLEKQFKTFKLTHLTFKETNWVTSSHTIVRISEKCGTNISLACFPIAYNFLA